MTFTRKRTEHGNALGELVALAAALALALIIGTALFKGGQSIGKTVDVETVEQWAR